MHVVVVGSGIAGLVTALHAVQRGCSVTLVTKDVLDHANTRFAQGGIAGVMFADDRVEDHIRDTLVAGAGLCDPAAVQVLAEEGPARIRELVDLGVAFDRGADGEYVKGLEAAHSYPRILHAGGDATGTAIERALVARLRASDVRVVEHAFLVDLVLEAPVREPLANGGGAPASLPRVVGVDLLIGDAPGVKGARETITADAVVLATGGAGQLYAHTTNPPVATGDGIAAALRAGAAVADLEFMQFHPTILAVGDAFLVSEAVRGEGATLIDDAGRRFALDAHPDGELAPRDVVARAIADRMAQQGGRAVMLDATHLRATPAETAAFLAERFPTIHAAVRDRGLDWAREPVPVTPAAHYLMGGVVTDLHGRTSLPGLYAVGEVARTGVHGANRLASNSLLEGAVFGARAGDALAGDVAAFRLGRFAPSLNDRDNGPRSAPSLNDRDKGPRSAPSLNDRDKGPRSAPSLNDRDKEPRSAPSLNDRDEGRPAAAKRRDPFLQSDPFSREALQELMWEKAGLVRDGEGLTDAAKAIAAWRAGQRAPRTESEFEDENLLLVAEAVVAAALARPDSVGAHFRSDARRGATPPIPAAAPAHPFAETRAAC